MIELSILYIFSFVLVSQAQPLCSYDNKTSEVTYCNLCSDDGMEFRVAHDCIACLDDTWYGLMMILLCCSILLVSMMVILFHSPMTYRTVSIWLWIQIAAIVFHRSSAVFTPIHKQWAVLSTITIFSTSIWKSQCNSNAPWDKGTSFGIVFIECVTLFLIFFCSTYIHHCFRHSRYSQYAQYSPYAQYQYNMEEMACNKYYKLLINALSVFEKRWQYQGNDNANNNDEVDDIVDDEHGSFVFLNPSHTSPVGHDPIHPPITSQLRPHMHPSSKGPTNGSPTITPITFHRKHDACATVSPHHNESHETKTNPTGTHMSIKPLQLSSVTKTNPKHLTTHAGAGAGATNSRMLTPTSNLRTLYTNTESTQYSSLHISHSTTNHEHLVAVPIAINDAKQIQNKKKKKRKKKLVKKKQMMSTRLRLGTDSIHSNTSNDGDMEHDESLCALDMDHTGDSSNITHYRHKSISSMTEEHLPTIKEISPVNIHSPPSIPSALPAPSCAVSVPTTEVVVPVTKEDHKAMDQCSPSMSTIRSGFSHEYSNGSPPQQQSAMKSKPHSVIKKFENNSEVVSHLNRLESVVEDQINDPNSMIHSRVSIASVSDIPLEMSPITTQVSHNNDHYNDDILTDSMNDHMNEHMADEGDINGLVVLAHSPTVSTNTGTEDVQTAMVVEGKTDKHFSFTSMKQNANSHANPHQSHHEIEYLPQLQPSNVSAVSQSSTNLSAFSSVNGGYGPGIVSPPSLKSPPSKSNPATDAVPSLKRKKMAHKTMKIKRQKVMNLNAIHNAHHNMVGVLKDEKAFEYPIYSDPNDALSEDTYYYMVDVVNNATHSRSASQITHSKKRDYPPHVDTIFSQTGAGADGGTAVYDETTPKPQSTQFTFPPSQNKRPSKPVKSSLLKPAPVQRHSNPKHHQNQNQNPNATEDHSGAADGSETLNLPGVDSQSFAIYLRVHNAVIQHLKSVAYDGNDYDPNETDSNKRIKSHSKSTIAKHEASTSEAEAEAEAQVPCTTPDPPSASNHPYYLTQNLSRPTRPIAAIAPATMNAMNIDHTLNQFVFEHNLKQRKEVPFEMAFNMTFLLCSPLILTEALQVLHCVEMEGSRHDSISIRSTSQYACSRDFWYYFGVFILIGWMAYVAMSIYRAKQFVKKIASHPDERWEQMYRNAFGDSFSFFWLNNVKLSKWWYGFIPILLQLLIIVSSVLFDDVNYCIMLISVLIWLEFVVMCCIRPYLTASDRLCQFTLRTCVLFESSMMVVAVHDNDTDTDASNHNLEPLNVAICSVIFVTLIISHFAACSGLYPIHPHSTVCSSCCCCCCFFCLEPMHEDDSDDEDEDDDVDYNEEQHRSHAIQLQIQGPYPPMQQQLIAAMNANVNSNTSNVGSDRPLLKQSGAKNNTDVQGGMEKNNNENENKLMQKAHEINKDGAENDKKDSTNSNIVYRQMLSPRNIEFVGWTAKQYSTANTITPYNPQNISTTSGKRPPQQPQPQRFNYSTSKNEGGFTLPQAQTGFYKHYHSQTHTDTQRSQSGMDNPHILDLKTHMMNTTVTSEHSMNFDVDIEVDVKPNNATAITHTMNQTQTQNGAAPAKHYNKVKSDSRQYNASIVSLNSVDSNTKTTTQQHQ